MKMKQIYYLANFLLLSFYPVFGQIDSNYKENCKKAFVAYTISECESSLQFCNQVLKIIPSHPEINYLSARLNSLLGNYKAAFLHLEKSTKLGYTTMLPFNEVHHLNDSAFDVIRDKKEFQDILHLLKESEKSVHKAEVAFIINDKDLLPEGIAYDPVEKIFYLGSETKQKIVKVDRYGKSMDFVNQGQNGLNLVILGLHVDPIRRTLWACVFDKTTEGILKFDLLSGKLIKKYTLLPKGRRYGYNDLVIHPSGDVYISDASKSAIYIIRESSDNLELYLKNESFISPNGITISADGNTIYLADTDIGIYKIDIITKNISLLSHDSDFSTYGIDGLYFKDNNLHAVQICLNQISRFSLNTDGSFIDSCEIFERNSLYLYKPTTGVIVDNSFYFIADTGGKALKQEGIIIMKATLK